MEKVSPVPTISMYLSFRANNAYNIACNAFTLLKRYVENSLELCHLVCKCHMALYSQIKFDKDAYAFMYYLSVTNRIQIIGLVM